MSWQDDLEACFSRLDRLYTAHVMDEGRAFELLASARRESISWNQLSNGVRDFLARDGCTPQQIEMHIADVERRFRPWLNEE